MTKVTWASIALIGVALSWGAGFVLMKDAIDQQPVYDFLATRFLLATLVMIAVRPQVIKAINRKLLIKGSILGSILGLGYVTQTLGLELSTAAITGFLTGLYVVITPIMVWLVFKKPVAKKVIIGVVLAFAALLLISFNGLSVEPGQLWLLACAVLFAAHITGLSAWSTSKDSYALTVIQLGTASVICWVGALSDGYQAPPNGFVWLVVFFTAVVATAFAFLIQTWAQSIMDASRVAILLTGEVIFAALISVAVGQEELALRTVIGGTLMVLAMLVVEWPERKERSALEQTHFT